jgi:hypothetical protein
MALIGVVWSVPFTTGMRVFKSKRMRWAKHVARMGRRRDTYTVLVVETEKRDHLEDLDINGRIILNVC